ncbi:MAG: PAS domain S-box protein, partial [Desulfobacula sp.]|nr:PAS domain S-box protein [Desulfobacula sp.]
IWVGTENNGLYRYDEILKTFTHFRYDSKDPESMASNRINYIMEDETGQLWISHENKLSLFNLKTGEFLRFKGELHDITMSFTDKTSFLVWGLTDTGKILVHNPKGNFFKQYDSIPGNKNSLSSEVVISIYEDSKGILWISTLKGFNRFDPETNKFTHYFHEPGNPASIPSTADYSPGIYEDKDHIFWIGNSLPSALSIFDRDKGKVVKTYYPNPSDSEAMPDAQQINQIIEDRENPDLMWLSTAKGLVRFNKKIEKFKTFGHDNSWDLFEDEDGFIWISTWGKGIGKFDKKTEKFDYFSHDPDKPESISGNLLVPIFIASDKSIWIGTENGLNLFDKEQKTFKSFKRSDGYPFDAIHSIGEDKNENLWLGTNAGLVRFNPVTLKARAFTKDDGVQSVMFYANNGITSKSGQMWFGGTKGMNSFFPDQITLNRHVPDIKLSSIKQGGEIIDFGKAPERLKTITLDWKNNFFEFEFIAFDYAAPKKNEYAYKLEGFDKEWFYSGNTNFGRYSGIPPGKYQLLLKGSNNDGIWNEDGLSVEIYILPPFWKTGWFFSFIALMVGAIIFIAVFYLIRLNSEVRERKKVEEKLKDSNDKLVMLDKLKDEFLANTSHELRTPLTGIIGLSESLIAGASGPMDQKAKKDLAMIMASGQRLSNLVNDILDFSKLRHKDLQLKIMAVDMHSLTNVVLAISRPIASSKPIKLENRVPKDLPYAKGDENRLQQILFNLVGNAVKFTREGKVIVSAQVIDKFIEISVFDTGIGISKEKHKTIFESFEQVDGSIEREFLGTGLGLAVSKQLVELHGGSIGLTSEPGEGSMFFFTMPMADKDAIIQVGEKSLFQVMDLQTEEIIPAESSGIIDLKNFSRDKPNILVVDDEAVNLQVLANHLSLQDYQVTQVTNGFDALKAIEQRDKSGELFDLVLLDVMMPGMSGYEVCEKLRAKYPPDKLPVVMLTAKNRAEDLAGLKSGANDYLTKPFNKTELLARIKNQKKLKDLAKKRQESQKALSDSEKQYRDLFNNLVDVFYRTDLDGRLVLVSPSFENVLGYAVEEAIGMNVAQTLYVNPEQREVLLRHLKEKGMVERFEAKFKKKDGTPIWTATSSQIYYDDQKNPAGVEGIFRDITRQKQAEQVRDLLATVIDQASEFIIVTDTNGNILYVNPAFENGTGYEKEEVLGKNPSILKSGKHDDAYYKNLWDTISKGHTWRGRLTNKRKDNSFFEEEATITPVKDLNGNIINYVGIKRDVTKEVRLESQLLQSQ